MSTQAPTRPRTVPLATPPARAGGLLAIAGLLLVVCLSSIAYGSLKIPIGDVIEALIDPRDVDQHAVVRDARLPRTLIGVAVGAALGVAGAVIQGMTRNPLADPGILGIEAGAAFMVVVAIFLLGVSTVAGYAWFALAGAAVAGVLVYSIGASGGWRAAPINLALAGAAVAALLVALTSAVLAIDANVLNQYRFWIVGSVAGRELDVLIGTLPFLGLGFLLAFASGRSLNALALGEDVARSLGQRVRLNQAIISAAFILLTGAAVAVAGPIVFVGLTVPHAARALIGPDYRWLLPYCALLGAILLLVADVIGRVVARPSEVDVGIIMAVVGTPVFIALVRRRTFEL